MFERVQNQQNPRWSSTFSLHKNQSLVEGSEQGTGLSTGLTVTATVYHFSLALYLPSGSWSSDRCSSNSTVNRSLQDSSHRIRQKMQLLMVLLSSAQ